MNTVRNHLFTIFSLHFITLCLCLLFTTNAAQATGNTPFSAAAQTLTAPLRQTSKAPTTMTNASSSVRTVYKDGRQVTFIMSAGEPGVSGVDTAGTVRVNNLANLEAMLNIIANCGEVAGIIGGGWLMASSFLNYRSAGKVDDYSYDNDEAYAAAQDRKKTISRATRGLVLGGIVIMLGISLPGTLNWLVASARDANLCN